MIYDAKDAVSTSIATKSAARKAGIPIIPFTRLDHLDLTIDGVDEIDSLMRAIKGAGGAMLREKVIAAASTRMIAIADGSKLVDRIGQASVPVEVLPMALAAVTRAIVDLGGRPVTRHTDAGAPTLTDQQNFIIDAAFGLIAHPRALATALSDIPGALGHGLFIDQIDELYLGTADGVVTLARRATTLSVDSGTHRSQSINDLA